MVPNQYLKDFLESPTKFDKIDFFQPLECIQGMCRAALSITDPQKFEKEIKTFIYKDEDGV